MLLTNDDNCYVPVFVEAMLAAFEQHPSAVMLACHRIHDEAEHHNHNRGSNGLFRSLFRPGYINLGAYVTRAGVAKDVGFNSTAFEADGDFVEEVRERLPDPAFFVVLDSVRLVQN